MGLIANRFNVQGEKRYNDFVRSVLALLNGNIDNDNIEDGLNLVTDAQLNTITQNSAWFIDGSSNLLRAGMPVYFSGVNTVNLADADDNNKKTRAFCLYTDGSNALVQNYGIISDVPIQSGITVSQGNKIWLSSTAGHVTNVLPTSGLEQSLGIATDHGTAAGGTLTLAVDIDSKGIQPF